MTNALQVILGIIKDIIAVLPIILLCLVCKKINLKQPIRSRQYLMPVLALIFIIPVMIFTNTISDKILSLIEKLSAWIKGTPVSGVGSVLDNLSFNYWIFFIMNVLILIAFLIYKGICLAIMRARAKHEGGLHESISGKFYSYFPERDTWCLREEYHHARDLLKVVYYVVLIVSAIVMIVSLKLYVKGLLANVFYPVIGIILVGELFFYLDGLTRREFAKDILGEDEDAYKVVNYSLLRKYLKSIFGDKLLSENTEVNNPLEYTITTDELLENLLDDEDPKIVNFGTYYAGLNRAGFKIDHNYMHSSLDLLKGKSILFNNPFYQDLIPYAFYPMNRTILSNQKVLVILGRHAIENDVEQWLRDGIESVTNIPFLWKIGLLGQTEDELDIGIVTRSKVIDANLQEENEEFLKKVGFVVIIEPSKLVATAQIGLNLLVKKCRGYDDKKIVYCMCDRNCDGLVDAMSHILMTNLTEISATNKHQGTSSYMCWDADNEYVHHRIFPNISRYLGLGTELSYAALRNQVSNTYWYGGDVFPVTDIRWIDRQYYYELMKYAALPSSQEAMNDYFHTSPNMWSATVNKNNYFTVEDESFNMYEVLRNFETRSSEQGFVNVVSSDYLLKDYMAYNASIFEADAKAIPYLVADYARTERNVVLRLMLLMCTSYVDEESVRKEFTLIGLPELDTKRQIWHEFYRCLSSLVGLEGISKDYQQAIEETWNYEIISDDGQYKFNSEIIKIEDRYNRELGIMQKTYSITDYRFIEYYVNELKSAGYVAEDEKGERYYMGSELRGHIYQKFLPGQFFTFNGKYYEMQYITADNQILVRRAADHIHGRQSYRQLRNYTISAIKPSEMIGAIKDIDGIKISEEYADISVSTPGYYRMERYNDFKKAKRVLFEGENSRIPERKYKNKHILRLDLPDKDGAYSPQVRYTITVLMNEVFRTLFADNQPYIVAVTDTSHIGDDAECMPLTYSIDGECIEDYKNSIFIIEDSQIDIGLIITVTRNLKRIFEIISDYLVWNKREIAKNLKPPKEEEPLRTDPGKDTDNLDNPEGEGENGESSEEEKKKSKNPIVRFFRAIANFFKKIFRKLFKKKKKDDEESEGEKPEDGVATEGEPEEGTPEEGTPEEGTPDEGTPDEGTPEEETPEEGTPDEGTPEEGASEEGISEGDEQPSDDDKKTKGFFKKLRDKFKRKKKSEESEESSSDDTAAQETEETELSTEEPANMPSPAKGGNSVEEGNQKRNPYDFTRQPYHLRYYLLYGYAGEPATIDSNATLNYLSGLGFTSNPLRDARNGKKIAKFVAENFNPAKKGVIRCDFCGCEIYGIERETLNDGRNRCVNCGRTAVKTEEEFKRIYEDVKRNMESFYGIKINAPVRVEMVDSRKLHKRIKSSPYAGGRTIGVAIREKHGGYTLIIENGSPRMTSMMTIAHELTHIWQYIHWNEKKIKKQYGKGLTLQIYEGMAKWAEIQYAYLINETVVAKREELMTLFREDEYGQGFIRYKANYPITTSTEITGDTPFMNIEIPLDPQYCGDVAVMVDPLNALRGYDEDDDELDLDDDFSDVDEDDDIIQEKPKESFLRSPDDVSLYAYAQLNAEEKELYDMFYKALADHNISLEGIPKWVTGDDLAKIRDYVLRDHPEMFWYNGALSYTSNPKSGKITGCKFTYCLSAEEVIARNNEINAAISDFLEGINSGMSDYDVAVAIYENIINLVDYDSLTLDRTGGEVSAEEPDDLRSIYGVFVNKKAVCAGYAKAAQYLFNRLGIECTYVTGQGKNEKHAWNLINIAGEYYYLDVTWDDHSNTSPSKDGSRAITYDYFCMTTEELLKDHTPDDVLPLPECTSTECNYFYRNGLVIETYSFARVRSIIKSKVQAGMYVIPLKAKSAETYAQMRTSLVDKKKLGDIIQYLNLDSITRVSSSYAYTDDKDKLTLTVYFNKI